MSLLFETKAPGQHPFIQHLFTKVTDAERPCSSSLSLQVSFGMGPALPLACSERAEMEAKPVASTPLNDLGDYFEGERFRNVNQLELSEKPEQHYRPPHCRQFPCCRVLHSLHFSAFRNALPAHLVNAAHSQEGKGEKNYAQLI